MSKILIIDDDEMLCNTIARHIKRMGHDVISAQTLEKGLEEFTSGAVDVVLLDVHLPDGSGLDLLPNITGADNSPEVIIITGDGDPDGAELAIKSGAWTYIEKPLSMKKLSLQLTRALQYRQERTKHQILIKREGLIGGSPQLESCLEQAAQVASGDVPVLITGETGTGKELFARTIHLNSPRYDKNFVVVDCAALPEPLVASILFGHEKGAFTGAEKAQAGLVKKADGGTLFLDEVGELPLSVQKDFLRVLQEYRVRPVGADHEVESRFRLLAATNRDLQKMAESGQFRSDLLYRIQSFPIELPPLRERPGDIKDLAIHFMIDLCDRQGIETKGFSPDFFEALAVYNWPGNVRELIRTMERAITVARFEPTLFPRHLPTNIRVHAVRTSVKSTKDKTESTSSSASFLPKLREVREAALFKAEKQYLHDLIMLTKKDIKEACRISGLSQSRLYHLLKKYRINRSSPIS